MKPIGFKTIPLSKLKVDGTIAKRKKAKHVRAMAESIRNYMLIEPLLVDADMKLIAGADRFAACSFAGLESVPCHVVACTPREAAILRELENSHRRHSEKEQKESEARLIAEIKKQLESEPERPNRTRPTRRKPGRPATKAGQALEKAAKELGKSKGALYQQERRRRQQEQQGETQLKDFELFGCEIDQEFKAELLMTITVLKASVSKLRAAARELEVPIDKEYSIPFGPLNSIRQQLEKQVETLHGMIPHCLCPGCKAQDGYADDCGFCASRGWISRTEANGVPRQLWDPQTVCVRGEYVKLDAGAPPEQDEDEPSYSGPSLDEVMEELQDGTAGVW